MADKCKNCGLTLTEDAVQICAWYQGRCPHQTSILDRILSDSYMARIYNILNWIRGKK